MSERRIAEVAHQVIDSARAGMGYLSSVLVEEFVGVETLSKNDDTRVVLALRAPHPSSEFSVSYDQDIKHADTSRVYQRVVSDIKKHASELRWNCIETMLRADVEARRLDTSRLCQWLVSNLDEEAADYIGVKLLERGKPIERAGKDVVIK